MSTHAMEVELSESTGELLNILSGLDQKQLNTKPHEGGWTAGQVGDHLLRSYAVVETLNGNTSPSDRKPDQKVAEVKSLFLDYTIKMESPEFIIPSESVDKQTLLQLLNERIVQLRDIARKNDLSEICLDFAIPEYGEFTKLEWLWFVVVHTQRHIHQLKIIVQEIK